MEQFEAWVHEINPDIIGVTESWASSSICDAELALQGYDLFRQDRPVAREGGGVLLYVKSELDAVKYELSTNTKVKCYIGVCYRTPTVDIFWGSKP